LGFGLYFNFHLAIQRINRYLAAKYCCVYVQLNTGIQVAANPFKLGIISNKESDVQVARRTAVGSCPAMTRYFNGLPVFNARGYRNADIFTIYS
jgi:hypothetical protein